MKRRKAVAKTTSTASSENADFVHVIPTRAFPLQASSEISVPFHHSSRVMFISAVRNVVADIRVELVSLRCFLCVSISNYAFFSKASFHTVLITSFCYVYVPHVGLVFLQKISTPLFPNYFIALNLESKSFKTDILRSV